MHLRVCAAFQRDLSRLEKQVICWKHMKFCKGILPPSPAPGDKKPIQQKKLEPAGWKTALPCSEQAGHEADEGPGSREDQQAPGLCWELFTSAQHQRHHAKPSSALPRYKKGAAILEQVQPRALRGLRNWKICHEERLRELGWLRS